MALLVSQRRAVAEGAAFLSIKRGSPDTVGSGRRTKYGRQREWGRTVFAATPVVLAAHFAQKDKTDRGGISREDSRVSVILVV